MKQYEHYIGVDVSKKQVDVACIHNATIEHCEFVNDASGMKLLEQWLLKLPGTKAEHTLFCMEATGLYCFTLTRFLVQKHIDIWIENAVQIKRSMGIARSKNDKIDAIRIAEYASKHTERLRLWKPKSNTIEKIKNLATVRERLVETLKKLNTPIKEMEETGQSAMAKMLKKSIKKTLTAIEKDLSNIEVQIITILNGDEELNHLYKLITSVVGIGFITAINLIFHTKGFTILTDTRKLACYCGVAPFEYSSGSSIRGKTKVHYMAKEG
jgi:transposase